MTETVSATTTSVHLIVVPHTHWDREWYQPFQEFRRRLVRLMDRLLAVLEEDSSFTHFHLDGQTIVIEDYLDIRPENRARLARLVRSGRIAVGPWYVLPDELLVSGESIIRNLLIGHRLAAQFGAPLKIGYLPDQFGHTAQMPQLLAGFGIDNAVLWRGVGADVDQTLFFWQAPNGSRALTVYLPLSGYSNGRSLPADPAALRERLQALIAEQAPFRRIDTILVMAGTDHQEPQAHLPAVLREAVRGWEGGTGEIAPLAAFVDRARRASGDGKEHISRFDAAGLPVHRGELRSPLRAHLLPGVTSARTRQKQRDFDNVSRLERYAEPLAAWVDWLAGHHDLTGFTSWAWKLAVQNHPHDSICGCSVDQVHQDMEYRFDQVEAVGKQVLRQAMTTLAARLDTSSAGSDIVLTVYNPNHATRTVVAADLYHDLPSDIAVLGLRDSRGRPIALQARAGAHETLIDSELPPDQVRPHVQTIEGREFLGHFINGIHFKRVADRLEVLVTVDRIIRGRLDVGAQRALWLDHLNDPALRTVRVIARTGIPLQVRFVADLCGHGFTCFSLTSDGGGHHSPFIAGEKTLENRFYRVSVNESDGSLVVLDKELGIELPRCNWFVDEGDRGDEYNFDALLDPQKVQAPAEPATVTIDAGGPVTAELTLALRYEFPARLEADRETRSPARVSLPIRTKVTLYADVKRVDFDTQLDNCAADHRLRVHFETPVAAECTHSEQAFATVERPIRVESLDGPEQPIGAVPQEAFTGPEQPVGTVPQKTFSCVEGSGIGVALFNRGIQEVEAMALPTGVGLALTLVRAVGWLSRSDLRMRTGHAGPGLETPGAQSLGPHHFAYALTTYRADWAGSGIVNRAHDFAYPPVVALTDRHAGDEAATCLVECDNPHVVLSAVTPAKRAGRLLVRLYNATLVAQVAKLKLAGASAVRCVNFLEQPSGKRIRRRREAWQVALDPAEIITLVVTGKPAAATRRRPGRE